MKKTKNKSKFDREFDKAMELAQSAKPKDIKVKIDLILDSDIFLELQLRTEFMGLSKKKYKTLINELLRQCLFEGR